MILLKLSWTLLYWICMTQNFLERDISPKITFNKNIINSSCSSYPECPHCKEPVKGSISEWRAKLPQPLILSMSSTTTDPVECCQGGDKNDERDDQTRTFDSTEGRQDPKEISWLGWCQVFTWCWVLFGFMTYHNISRVSQAKFEI